MDPYPVDPLLVKRTIKTLLKVVDGYTCRRIYGTTLRITADDNLAASFAAEVGLTEEESTLISDLSAVLAQKYQLAGTYAPEILLGVCVAGYGTRCYMMLQKLDELEAKLAPKEKAAPAPPADQKAA
ncbi:MAG: hypothetical protein HY299_09815 [Verrucomicrobia bacterium]|nr:hypothetical protein [Verrucomicrobiota bacterium]